ncbi:MAG: MmcQ/YjbR family DNA-binding protein [Acidimicrobiales bacterium]|jgi:predicted DNA-binding protein (MmcQ/YjbR family)
MSGGDAGPSTPGDRVVDVCASLPGAQLTFPFGPRTAVYKVADKMFALVATDGDGQRVNLKCDPDYASYLVQQYDGIVPGYHMNKRHWITVTLADTVPWDVVEELIHVSYDLVVSSLSAKVRGALTDRPRDGR